jgi:hypothetical protein
MLTMQPVTVTIDSLANGTTKTNLVVVNTAADAAISMGAFTGAFFGNSTGASQVITGSPVGTTPGLATVTYAAPPTIGTVNFSYTITNTSNTSDVQSSFANKATSFFVSVGNSTADNTGKQPLDATAFNGATTMSGTVAHNGSYAGLESQITTLSGTGGFDASNGTSLGGTAIIRAGVNSLANGGSAATVAMQWRTLSTSGAINEQTGAGPGLHGRMYATNLSATTTGLISDVVNLTGLTQGVESAGGVTDPFVLQMSYNPSRLPKGGTVEAGLAAKKLITMVSFNSGNGRWDRAVDDNSFNRFTSTADAFYGFLGSWDTFATNNFGAVTPDGAHLAAYMGAWGVDTTNHVVWAILNHNSQFAVVPEPSTILLAGLGALGLCGLRRRVPLCQQLGGERAVDVGEAEVAALEAEGELYVVEAEEV